MCDNCNSATIKKKENYCMVGWFLITIKRETIAADWRNTRVEAFVMYCWSLKLWQALQGLKKCRGLVIAASAARYGGLSIFFLLLVTGKEW